MTKGRQLEQNFEELKPALHVPIFGTILNIFDVFVAVFFRPVQILGSIALKLQIGIDDDKKESKYQKYIY
jgi:uncharacterized metal-binding protein